MEAVYVKLLLQLQGRELGRIQVANHRGRPEAHNGLMTVGGTQIGGILARGLVVVGVPLIPIAQPNETVARERASQKGKASKMILLTLMTRGSLAEPIMLFPTHVVSSYL